MKRESKRGGMANRREAGCSRIEQPQREAVCEIRTINLPTLFADQKGREFPKVASKHGIQQLINGYILDIMLKGNAVEAFF